MKYNDKVVNRVKRLEGQLKGILNMMEDEKECKEVITQLSAVRSAIDRCIGIIVSENLVKSVTKEDNEENKHKIVKEAVDLLVKSR